MSRPLFAQVGLPFTALSAAHHHHHSDVSFPLLVCGFLAAPFCPKVARKNARVGSPFGTTMRPEKAIGVAARLTAAHDVAALRLCDARLESDHVCLPHVARVEDSVEGLAGGRDVLDVVRPEV